MGNSVTIGGERLGSGKKTKAYLHGYERSTHDLSYVWKNTMASGTLVPFMSQLALPGDNWSINLNTDIQTHPTVGPLFDTFKVQLDIFQCPVRLYNSALHNNRLDIGNKMEQIKLPKIEIEGRVVYENQAIIYKQINPSSILNYLGINAVGYPSIETPSTVAEIPYTTTRKFNAVPIISYLDIFKNYYANKQEEDAYMIHTNPEWNYIVNNITFADISTVDGAVDLEPFVGGDIIWKVDTKALDNSMLIIVAGDVTDLPIPSLVDVKIEIDAQETIWTADKLYLEWNVQYNPVQDQTAFTGSIYSGILNEVGKTSVTSTIKGIIRRDLEYQVQIPPKLKKFPLSEIDDLRENILSTKWNEEFKIDQNITNSEYFANLLKSYNGGQSEPVVWAKEYAQEGLLVKCYQSDLYNNWINTEWLDGENGINELTSVKVNEDGEITMNQISLMKKLWEVLNRIALSGGTYKAWIETVYDEDSFYQFETPMYMGGLSQELGFQQVVSNSETPTQPLGTLGGRGQISGKGKGGHVNIKVNEPCYIIGIASLTPRISYSQGNQWDVNLDSLADFHYPGLDQIGFQNLITDQLSAYDTQVYGGATPSVKYRSAGKQPAWINYMTNVNKNYGNFAIRGNEMFMTLDRRYEHETIVENIEGQDIQTGLKIKDLTTYIDPSKYNYAFAETSIDAMNFWMQIDVNITARRKMSAQVMPNL